MRCGLTTSFYTVFRPSRNQTSRLPAQHEEFSAELKLKADELKATKLGDRKIAEKLRVNYETVKSYFYRKGRQSNDNLPKTGKKTLLPRRPLTTEVLNNDENERRGNRIESQLLQLEKKYAEMRKSFEDANAENENLRARIKQLESAVLPQKLRFERRKTE